MLGVSVSDADLEAGSPKAGDMIARSPKNPEDRWLVAAKYFRENLEPVPDDVPKDDVVKIDFTGMTASQVVEAFNRALQERYGIMVTEKRDDTPKSVELRAKCVLGADGWHVIAKPNVIDLDYVKTACGSAICKASRLDVCVPDCPSCREALRGWARYRDARAGVMGGGA